ncbi:MAG: DUF5131 family protein [Clostridiaceae bacterium]|nr:DUF5131 family protein [Clostridiaceae bacterium]
MEGAWNPWHGCRKYSAGCQNCYVYRRDTSVGRDASVVRKTADYALGTRKNRDGSYKIPSGTQIFLCMTSDFFLDDADPWRDEIWDMVRVRRDLRFFIITKRILRVKDCLPDDWGDGWEHVAFGCTVENQAACDTRIQEFLSLPLRHRFLICEPLLEEIILEPYLTSQIERVIAGGESGEQARVCDYAWIVSLRDQCVRRGVPFWFKQTGAYFRRDGRVYDIPRERQGTQARRMALDTTGGQPTSPA